MNFGYTVWTWMKGEFLDPWIPTKDAKRLFENAARDISYLGYKHIENFSFIVPVYENNKADLDKILDECNLTFACIYQELSGNYDSDYQNTERCCRFMQENEIEILNIEAPQVPVNDPVTDDLLDELCEALNKIGEIANKHNVVACLHQHTRTLCETQSQLDYIMTNTDDSIVRLCLDSCHLVLAGMDPIIVFKKYANRVSYVHLKDVIGDYKKPYRESVTENARALGEGIIDFIPIIDVLNEAGYEGLYTVEVDYPNPDSFGAARTSMEYLMKHFQML